MLRRSAPSCAIVVMLAGAMLSGCSSESDDGPVDPSHELLTESITGGDYSEGKVVMRDLGTGPVQRRLRLPAGYDAMQLGVTCVPEEDYTVTFGGGFSSNCGRKGSNSGTIPREAIDDATMATLKIPSGTRRWFVAIALKDAARR